MLHFTLLLECQFWGNVTNIPAVLQPSSACQWFRLLTVYCQRFLHQPIVFLRCEANAYFIGSGCDNSLSFLFFYSPTNSVNSKKTFISYFFFFGFLAFDPRWVLWCLPRKEVSPQDCLLVPKVNYQTVYPEKLFSWPPHCLLVGFWESCQLIHLRGMLIFFLCFRSDLTRIKFGNKIVFAINWHRFLVGPHFY